LIKVYKLGWHLGHLRDTTAGLKEILNWSGGVLH